MEAQEINNKHTSSGKRMLSPMVVFGGLAAFLYLSGLLTPLVFVPLFYVYYKQGRRLFLSSVLCAFVVVGLFTLIPLIFTKTGGENLSLPITENGEENIAPFDVMNLYSLFTFAIQCIAFMVLVFSCNRPWFTRIGACLATLLLGNLVFFDRMRDFFFEIMNAVSVDFGMPLEEGALRATDLSLYIHFLPVNSLILILFNWNIAIFFLCWRGNVNATEYYQYLYHKLLHEFTKVPRLVLLIVMLVLGVFLASKIEVSTILPSINIKDSTQQFYALLISTFALSALVYFILGIAYTYYLLRHKKNINVIWYFFLICIIMLLPIVNLFLFMFLLGRGVRFDWKKNIIFNKINNEVTK